MKLLEEQIIQDPGGRGVGALLVPGDLEAGARALGAAQRVLILTGFAVGPNAIPETDGPPGALFLGRALAGLGKQVTFATHWNCEAVLAAGMAALGLWAPLEAVGHGDDPVWLLERHKPDLVVAVELPGRAPDGNYYSMRGLCISERVSLLDGLLPAAGARGLTTLGVGDGGNEAGMGKVFDRVRAAIPRGDLIASIIAADHLIAAGTSNWGCYGLLAAMDRNLVPSPAEELLVLDAINRAGAVNAHSLTPEPIVDGLDQAVYLQMLSDLKGVQSR